MGGSSGMWVRGSMWVRGRILCSVAGAILAACAPLRLPVDGPYARDITSGATTSLVSDRHSVVLDYALLDINKTVLECAIDVRAWFFLQNLWHQTRPATDHSRWVW